MLISAAGSAFFYLNSGAVFLKKIRQSHHKLKLCVIIVCLKTVLQL